jgi:PAS domain S-box-containing protein
MRRRKGWIWIISTLFWTAVIGLFAIQEINSIYDMAIKQACSEANASYQKDLVTRRWISIHGGIYAPITVLNPPNPYLKHIPERDIETPSGQRLTLINPAYMTRQIHELGDKEFGIKAHATSLKPLSASNFPDPWEENALKLFEQGITNVQDISTIDGEKALRVMYPLYVEESCLKCHESQGYEIGDVRGGLSSTVPLEQYLLMFRQSKEDQIIYHSLVWFLGLLGLYLSRNVVNKQFKKTESTLANLLKTEKELLKQKNVFEKAQELGEIGSWEVDLQRNKLFWSNETYKIFGVLPETEVNYDLFIDKVHPEDRRAVARSWEEALGGKPFDTEHRLIIADEIKWVREKADVFIDKNGKAISALGFTHDITELKSLQGKAVRLAQMATVGELSAVVAHEVNNPLSGVINYAQIMLNRCDSDGQDKEMLERIVKEGNRIAKIVNSLLVVSHDSGHEKTLTHLEPVVSESLSLLSHFLKKDAIRVDVNIPRELPAIRCNAQQIEQVILNIVRNAHHALLEGTLAGADERHIIIEAESIVLDNKKYVRLSIDNNGPNIPEELREKIKEPFLTTKPAGIGTGLGLSVSNDIMADHNGMLKIESEPEEYTKMTLYFLLDLPEG